MELDLSVNLAELSLFELARVFEASLGNNVLLQNAVIFRNLVFKNNARRKNGLS